MTTINDLCQHLETIAPLELAEDWDNVGLLVGSTTKSVTRVMTCLTITPPVVAEAVAQNADLIVTHHPLPFRSLKTITDTEPVGRMLLELITNGVAIYSAHTAFDSASDGINRQLAEGLELAHVTPLFDATDSDPSVGTGRCGELPETKTLDEVAETLKTFLGIQLVRVVGPADTNVQRIGIACGSAGQFIAQARSADCQALVTGETSFHTCLEAEATQVGLLLLGHYASERFAMENLASRIAEKYSDLTVWASHSESDPLRLV